MSKILCGAHRPGHFDGVLTVVMKLLGLAQAHKCYMGEKDYQQFMLVKEMVAADVDHFRKERLLKESGYTIKNQFE